MDRRSFFGSVGSLAVAPLVAPVAASLTACVGRDGTPGGGPEAAAIAEFRAFQIPDVEPALPFRPLRRMPRR